MARLSVDNPGLLLHDLMIEWSETISVFLRHRMLCVVCLIAPFHTVVGACLEHGVEEVQFRAELRAAAGDPHR